MPVMTNPTQMTKTFAIKVAVLLISVVEKKNKRMISATSHEPKIVTAIMKDSAGSMTAM